MCTLYNGWSEVKTLLQKIASTRECSNATTSYDAISTGSFGCDITRKLFYSSGQLLNCMMQEILLFQGTVLQWLLANIVREIAFGPVDHKRELYR